MLHFLALAFSDNAFKAPGLNCPEALYQMKVSEPRQALELEWNDSVMNKCVFRRAKMTEGGLQTSDEAWPYHTISRLLVKASKDAGFPQNMIPYAIRRATGNAVNSTHQMAISPSYLYLLT